MASCVLYACSREFSLGVINRGIGGADPFDGPTQRHWILHLMQNPA
jgi:hypothetical protein